MYLRKIDPFVFEELVLTAYKNQGHKIKRNKRYTGDGGVDGRVTINGQKYLIQAKRYRSYINRSHIEEFAAICRRQNVAGIFAHTGKTGITSWVEARKGSVTVVSGGELLQLLDTKPS